MQQIDRQTRRYSHAQTHSSQAKVRNFCTCQTHARMLTRTHAHTDTHTYIHSQTHTHTNTHTRTHARACAYGDTHACARGVHTDTLNESLRFCTFHTHTHTHTTHTHTHTHAHSLTHARTHTYTQARTHTHARVHTRTHTRTTTMGKLIQCQSKLTIETGIPAGTSCQSTAVCCSTQDRLNVMRTNNENPLVVAASAPFS